MLKSFRSLFTLLSIALLCVNVSCKKEETITPVETDEVDGGVSLNLGQFPLRKPIIISIFYW